LTLNPVDFAIACRNGSQFFFWFVDASVEMTPEIDLDWRLRSSGHNGGDQQKEWGFTQE
jgi:hypothetical protein